MDDLRKASCAALQGLGSRKKHTDSDLPTAKFDVELAEAAPFHYASTEEYIATEIDLILDRVVERLHSAVIIAQSAENVAAYELSCQQELNCRAPLTATELPKPLHEYHTECTRQRAEWLSYMFDQNFWNDSDNASAVGLHASIVSEVQTECKAKLPSRTCPLSGDTLVALTYTVTAAIVHKISPYAKLLHQNFADVQTWRKDSTRGLSGISPKDVDEVKAYTAKKKHKFWDVRRTASDHNVGRGSD